jgi:hypothetical protein
VVHAVRFILGLQVCIQLAGVDPLQQIATVGDRPVEDVDLRAETVVRRDDDPAARETVVDLRHGDHARVAEHEGAAVDVDYCVGESPG